MTGKSSSPAESAPTAVLSDIGDVSAEEWYEISEDRGWGDGLPTLTPTVKAVDRLIATAGVDPLEVIGPIPPRGTRASMQSLAANAVMAGCTGLGFRVVLVALRCALQEAFNLSGVATTTHPATPLVILNGPIRSALGCNSSTGCMGPGNRANATIGRALQLIISNLGGARPGLVARATHAAPTKYTYCFAENEEASPWKSWAVRRGYRTDDSVVSVIAGEAPHTINDPTGALNGEEVIETIIGTMMNTSSFPFPSGEGTVHWVNLVVLGIEHARTLHRDGWSPGPLAEALHERAAVPADIVPSTWLRGMAQKNVQAHDGVFPMGGSPDRIQIMVAGGVGLQSAWIPVVRISDLVANTLDYTPP